jgi:LPS sulfotransferase NodH
MPHPDFTAADILDRCIWHANYDTSIQAVGLKILAYQMHWEGRFPNLREHLGQRLAGGKVILLLRQNLLHLHVSFVVSGKLRVWHADAAHRPKQRPRVSFTPEQLRQAFERFTREEQQIRQLAQLAGDVYELTYQDLTGNKELHWREIQGFLGVQTVPLPAAHLVKLETRTMRQAITNYEELRRHFDGTCWGRFFDE